LLVVAALSVPLDRRRGARIAARLRFPEFRELPMAVGPPAARDDSLSRPADVGKYLQSVGGPELVVAPAALGLIFPTWHSSSFSFHSFRANGACAALICLDARRWA